MPVPGSHEHDKDRARVRRQLEEQGGTDRYAAEEAKRAVDDAADPGGHKHVSARRAGAGTRVGKAWPRNPEGGAAR